jgi:hypothetical protein
VAEVEEVEDAVGVDAHGAVSVLLRLVLVLVGGGILGGDRGLGLLPLLGVGDARHADDVDLPRRGRGRARGFLSLCLPSHATSARGRKAGPGASIKRGAARLRATTASLSFIFSFSFFLFFLERNATAVLESSCSSLYRQSPVTVGFSTKA